MNIGAAIYELNGVESGPLFDDGRLFVMLAFSNTLVYCNFDHSRLIGNHNLHRAKISDIWFSNPEV